MIKLTRLAKPAFLTPEKVTELTSKYKADKSSVWNTAAIKEPLLNSSHGKCAYCECLLTAESNYMEVEHFEDKSSHPDKVVEWENLLPSCKKCNGAKSTHDVNKEPIVNPYNEDPKNDLAMRLYRIKGKTDKGVTTIDVVDLNHTERLVRIRFDIGEKIQELVKTGQDRLSKYKTTNSVRNRNRLNTSIEGLLYECQPTSNYAASTATILLKDSDFINILKSMNDLDIWTGNLESLYNNAAELVLNTI